MTSALIAHFRPRSVEWPWDEMNLGLGSKRIKVRIFYKSDRKPESKSRLSDISSLRDVAEMNVCSWRSRPMNSTPIIHVNTRYAILVADHKKLECLPDNCITKMLRPESLKFGYVASVQSDHWPMAPMYAMGARTDQPAMYSNADIFREWSSLLPMESPIIRRLYQYVFLPSQATAAFLRKLECALGEPIAHSVRSTEHFDRIAFSTEDTARANGLDLGFPWKFDQGSFHKTSQTSP